MKVAKREYLALVNSDVYHIVWPSGMAYALKKTLCGRAPALPRWAHEPTKTPTGRRLCAHCLARLKALQRQESSIYA